MKSDARPASALQPGKAGAPSVPGAASNLEAPHQALLSAGRSTPIPDSDSLTSRATSMAALSIRTEVKRRSAHFGPRDSWGDRRLGNLHPEGQVLLHEVQEAPLEQHGAFVGGVLRCNEPNARYGRSARSPRAPASP